MTFIIKTRGTPTGLTVAEYRCPEHGVFEGTVEKPAPDDLPCPDCGDASPWTISAPRPLVDSKPCFAAVRGGDMKDRPPHMLDTRPLAEGMKKSEWDKLQRENVRRRRHKQLIDKGVIQKKIVVG